MNNKRNKQKKKINKKLKRCKVSKMHPKSKLKRKKIAFKSNLVQ